MFIVGDQSYISTKLQTESEFENLLIENQSEIFPNFFLFETKKSATTSIGEKTHVDLCLISKSCEQWFIVEVELQKGDSYTKGHIREQLSKQVQADWTSLINEMQKRLKKEGVNRKVYSRLEEVDWGNMLIIDQTSPAVDRVCTKYGVSLVEIHTMMSHRGDYGLFVRDPEAIPEFLSDEDRITVSSSEIKCVAGTLYVPLPISLLEKIRAAGNSCRLITDSGIMTLVPNLTDQLEIPVSQNMSSSTVKLSRKVIDAGFDVRNEDEVLLLTLVEVDNW